MHYNMSLGPHEWIGFWKWRLPGKLVFLSCDTRSTDACSSSDIAKGSIRGRCDWIGTGRTCTPSWNSLHTFDIRESHHTHRKGTSDGWMIPVWCGIGLREWTILVWYGIWKCLKDTGMYMYAHDVHSIDPIPQYARMSPYPMTGMSLPRGPDFADISISKMRSQIEFVPESTDWTALTLRCPAIKEKYKKRIRKHFLNKEKKNSDTEFLLLSFIEMY